MQASVSLFFLAENYANFSFSDEQLREKQTGLPARKIPPEWQDPKEFGIVKEAAFAEGPSFMEETIAKSPVLMAVTDDHMIRAPASEGDFLGMMSLGCVLENIWLAAAFLGLGLQVLSGFSTPSLKVGPEKSLDFPTFTRSLMSFGWALRSGKICRIWKGRSVFAGVFTNSFTGTPIEAWREGPMSCL